MPKIQFICITTHYHTLLYITIVEPGILARIMDNQVQLEAHLRETAGKGLKGGSVRFAYQLPGSILGRLPVVLAGDMWTIPFSYSSGCSNGAHHFSKNLASAVSSRGAGDGSLVYFVNSWALGWSHDP